MDNKRQYRELSDKTKQKISTSSTGKPKSSSHKQHLSQAMKDYWATIPNKPQDGHTTMADIIGADDKN